MSSVITKLENTGRKNKNNKGNVLEFTSFWGGKSGQMIQLTQGFGCSQQLNIDEPGYIQLTILDAYKVINILTNWIKDKTKNKADILQLEIDKNKELKKTILKNIIECQQFIDDLKVLEIPLILSDKITN